MRAFAILVTTTLALGVIAALVTFAMMLLLAFDVGRARASPACMTKAEARKAYPTSHLYWTGPDHCWGPWRKRPAQRPQAAQPGLERDGWVVTGRQPVWLPEGPPAAQNGPASGLPGGPALPSTPAPPAALPAPAPVLWGGPWPPFDDAMDLILEQLTKPTAAPPPGSNMATVMLLLGSLAGGALAVAYVWQYRAQPEWP